MLGNGENRDINRKKVETIHLSEEELIKKLPEKIGKVTLDYRFYPGEDLYSDGTIEDELLEIVRNSSRVEYPGIIEKRNSWPILYHLSTQRGNIVDWLPIKSTDKVLEVGAGCGAITDKLSEKAGWVTCVDLSAKRSKINAYRNQDRDNIEIYVGNFSDIEPALPTDYDYICMIGAFEYGQSYIHTKTPYEDFLKIMQKHVKDSGRIVIAIENKFGLKYWAGCKEDHTGGYFDGLEGYPEGGSARTFTRVGLEKIFLACGLSKYSFYYPYPDYKFPTAIYSDKRLPRPGELIDNMRNFDRDRMVVFNEKYVFDEIIRDRMFGLFSNSYFAVVGRPFETVYVKYSNDRAREYGMRTEIRDTENGKVVRKIPMSSEAKAHMEKLARFYELLADRYEGSGLSINPCKLSQDGKYAEFPYQKGVTLEERLDGCLATGDMDGFYRLFDRYIELVSYGEEKNVADYDLIFANILVEGDSWTVIDYEWTVERQVPAAEIAFRALYCYVLEEEKRNKIDLDLLLKKLGISQNQAKDLQEKERQFQKQVTGKQKSMGELRSLLGTYAVDPKVLMEQHLKEILEKRIQIYFDRGNGFSEGDSIYMPDVYVKENYLEVEIPADGNMKAVRIDPADRSCVVKICQLDLNGEPIPLQKKYFETNGKTIRNGCYVFATQDPNLVIKFLDLPVRGENVIVAKMEVSPISQEMAVDVAGAVKRIF